MSRDAIRQTLAREPLQLHLLARIWRIASLLLTPLFPGLTITKGFLALSGPRVDNGENARWRPVAE